MVWRSFCADVLEVPPMADGGLSDLELLKGDCNRFYNI